MFVLFGFVQLRRQWASPGFVHFATLGLLSARFAAPRGPAKPILNCTSALWSLSWASSAHHGSLLTTFWPPKTFVEVFLGAYVLLLAVLPLFFGRVWLP